MAVPVVFPVTSKLVISMFISKWLIIGYLVSSGGCTTGF